MYSRLHEGGGRSYWNEGRVGTSFRYTIADDRHSDKDNVSLKLFLERSHFLSGESLALGVRHHVLERLLLSIETLHELLEALIKHHLFVTSL